MVNGQSLSIDDGNEINFGTPLTAFLGTYPNAITRSEESSELRWFIQLEEQSRKNLRILAKIFYGEDMLYSPNDYERFLADWGRIYGEVSEAEFKKKLDEVAKMWTPIDEVLPVVEEIILLLPRMGEDTHWYTAENTQPSFKALHDTLKRAQRRGGTKVRILIR